MIARGDLVLDRSGDHEAVFRLRGVVVGEVWTAYSNGGGGLWVNTIGPTRPLDDLVRDEERVEAWSDARWFEKVLVAVRRLDRKGSLDLRA